MRSSAVYSGVESFSDNDELTEVTFAKGVTTIGDYAFIGCSSLADITIPALLNSRWHRILERVAVLSCLKAPWNDDLEIQPRSDEAKQNSHLDGDEVVALQGIVARKMLPKVMWRVILEFL